MRWLNKAKLGKSIAVIASCGLVSFVVAACGSSGGSEFPNGGADASADGRRPEQTGDLDFDSGKLADAPLDLDAYYFQDPPPQWCGPDGGATPPPAPGGSAECPSDKNRQGCPCTTEGQTAACWTGPRANRNLGVCKDGQTVCQKTGELTTAWGPCNGVVLPKPGATKGADACKCFSAGEWAIKNIMPCFWEVKDVDGNVTSEGINSSFLVGDTAKCEGITRRPENFSTDTLKVDCEGTFDLCMVIKAGNIKNPLPGDCAIMDPICTGPFDYPKKNVETTFPPLKSWDAATPAQKTCAAAFKANGGYAELSVVGKSYTCDAIDDGNGQRFVFQRFEYCPYKCALNPALAECAGCRNGASGEF